MWSVSTFLNLWVLIIIHNVSLHTSLLYVTILSSLLFFLPYFNGNNYLSRTSSCWLCRLYVLNSRNFPGFGARITKMSNQTRRVNQQKTFIESAKVEKPKPFLLLKQKTLVFSIKISLFLEKLKHGHYWLLSCFFFNLKVSVRN